MVLKLIYILQYNVVYCFGDYRRYPLSLSKRMQHKMRGACTTLNSIFLTKGIIDITYFSGV